MVFHAALCEAMGVKDIDCSGHFLILNYRGFSLNFLILAHLLTDDGTESNSGPTQNM